MPSPVFISYERAAARAYGSGGKMVAWVGERGLEPAWDWLECIPTGCAGSVERRSAPGEGLARALAVAALSGLLGACVTTGDAVAPNKPANDWTIDTEPDLITGAGARAWVRTTNATPPPGQFFPRPVFIQLRCFNGAPVVQLNYPYKVGTNSSASLGYRFHGKTGHENVRGRFLTDRSHFLIEDRSEVAAFVAELADSAVLSVSVRSLVLGKSDAIFPVRGGPAAAAAAFAGCPLPAPARTAASGK